jgi:Flp pilus assembly protein TadG
VEFAFAIPVLLLIVVGIWDFGSAFALKQKLTNAASATTRIVISTPSKDPANPVNCGVSTVPCSVVAAATAAQQYLKNAGLQYSWISPTSPSYTPGADQWTYFSGSSSTGSTTAPSNGPELIINDCAGIEANGNVVTIATAGSTQATQVTLLWPLQWFAQGFLPPSALPSSLTVNTTMANIGGGCAEL